MEINYIQKKKIKIKIIKYKMKNFHLKEIIFIMYKKIQIQINLMMLFIMIIFMEKVTK
jgi:hypothetical protein